jgi:hypothetical protein
MKNKLLLTCSVVSATLAGITAYAESAGHAAVSDEVIVAQRYALAQSTHGAGFGPHDTGTSVQYAGSTTGPSYNETGSPFQVTWSVRPEVAKLSISSVDTWLQGIAFDEDHAHGVRNLVVNPELLSETH